MSDKELRFYDCEPHRERLYHCELHEAVEAHLDQTPVEHWPEDGKLKVYCWEHLDHSGYLDWRRFVDDAIEALDEEYGDPDGDGHEATKAMRKAAETFCRAIEAEYTAFACEQVPGATESIDVREWIRDGAEHWMENPEIAAYVASAPPPATA